MTEPAITPELVAKHNLTPEEYAHAKEILGGRDVLRHLQDGPPFRRFLELGLRFADALHRGVEDTQSAFQMTGQEGALRGSDGLILRLRAAGA